MLFPASVECAASEREFALTGLHEDELASALAEFALTGLDEDGLASVLHKGKPTSVSSSSFSF